MQYHADRQRRLQSYGSYIYNNKIEKSTRSRCRIGSLYITARLYERHRICFTYIICYGCRIYISRVARPQRFSILLRDKDRSLSKTASYVRPPLSPVRDGRSIALDFPILSKRIGALYNPLAPFLSPRHLLFLLLVSFWPICIIQHAIHLIRCSISTRT